MPDSTKRILTDETGQDIVSALQSLQNVIDPNGTAVAAAAKIDNMTVAASGLAAGATPTATISEVSGHKHIAFGIPAGHTPQFSIGTVSSLSHGSTPTATLTGTTQAPVLNLGIPAGASGNETIDDTAGIGDTDLVYSADKMRKELDRKSPAIYEEIESVPLATFADGAEDMPLKNLKVAIEPVQDLHGYDHPWPAGGGKNKFDPNSTENMWVGADMSITNQPLCKSVQLPSSAGQSWSASMSNIRTSTNLLIIVFFDGNNNVLSRSIISDGQKALTATAPENTETVLCSLYRYSEAGDVQFELGSTATDYEPYSNICPISGLTGAKVTRTGKNLLNFEGANYYNNNIYFGGSQQGNKIVVDGSFILKAGTYTASANANMTAFYLFDETGQIGIKNSSTVYTFTLSEEKAICFRCYMLNTQTKEDFVQYDIQLELGSTATDYEPYQGNTYDITFPSEAGTVYGGTLDVVTGEMVVDRAMETITKDGIWYSFAVGSGNASAVIQLNNYQNVKYVDGISSYNGSISSVGIEAPNYWVSARQDEIPIGDMCFAYSNGGQLRIHRTDVSKITDIASFKENLPDVQIVYPLATPITYQLTPQEVRTLLGQNNIWADTGDVSLLYPADTKAYIDNQIASTRKLIAGIETEFKASKAYSVGDMLIIGNDLYKVSASIASGATITVGTNVTKTTVAEQLIALANA